MIVGRIGRQGNSFGLVIPRKLLAQLAWQPGDVVELRPGARELRVRNLMQRSRPAGARVEDETTPSDANS